MPPRSQPLRPRLRAGGWSLLELLLALGLGLGLCAVMLQALVQDSQLGAHLVRQVRERRQQRRSLALIPADLGRAERVWLEPAAAQLVSVCPQANRRVVLQLDTREGRITYSQGPAPSAIWRGEVLLRCGPAFDLEGAPSSGAFQNRVLLDGLDRAGLQATPPAPGLLTLVLQQRFAEGATAQTIRSEMVVAAAGLQAGV